MFHRRHIKHALRATGVTSTASHTRHTRTNARSTTASAQQSSKIVESVEFERIRQRRLVATAHAGRAEHRRPANGRRGAQHRPTSEQTRIKVKIVEKHAKVSQKRSQITEKTAVEAERAAIATGTEGGECDAAANRKTTADRWRVSSDLLLY